MSWFEFLDVAGRFIRGAGWVLLPVLALPVLRLLIPKSSGLKSMAEQVVLMIDGTINLLGEAIKWTMLAMVFSVAFSVFADVVFGLAWTKLYETGIYLHAAGIMLGSAACLLAGQHVRVDIFHSRMTPQNRARIDLLGYFLLLMPLCLLILWKSQGLVKGSWRTFEGFAEADSFRALHIMKTFIPVFCVTMLAQGLAIALRAVNLLSGDPAPRLPKNISPLFEQEEKHHGP